MPMRPDYHAGDNWTLAAEWPRRGNRIALPSGLAVASSLRIDSNVGGVAVFFDGFMAAERERRATVTTAEGKREAQVTVAEGEKNAAILEAEGRKQSSILLAEGEQKAIEKVLSVSQGNEKDFETIIGYLLGLEYLKTLPDMAKNGERVFVPYESSALIGALGTFQNLGSDVAGGAHAGKALATLGASSVSGSNG